VVTAEQFFMDQGHWPRMAQLINKRMFASKVKFLFVDEAHSTYTFGTSLYGKTAYRLAWAYLADL
jgi:7-keto-8-aminopelargonate synthetase-like enzyme